MYQTKDAVFGIEQDESPELIANFRDFYRPHITRRYCPNGTASDRKVRVMTNRVAKLFSWLWHLLAHVERGVFARVPHSLPVFVDTPTDAIE
ncbi:hypothetical protein BH10PLA2_BH10PLA2_09030 [soil metagenome]